MEQLTGIFINQKYQRRHKSVYRFVLPFEKKVDRREGT